MGNIIYPRFLADAIIEERAGEAYTFEENDLNVLKQMCDEINQTYSEYPYKFHYLSEFQIIGLPVGASAILLKYIYQFQSESCRAVLIKSIVIDKVKRGVKIMDLDRIIMDLYHHFRASSYYIPAPGPCTSAHIYITYDNAFNYLKSQKLVPELLELMRFRREIYILSITAFMIAKKWTPKELGEIMATHLMNKNVTRADVGIPGEGEYRPSLKWIAEQTSFNAIKCLQFYPSQENLKIITQKG